ncbi:MAG: hypothetical protein WEC12_04725 [Balneolaceae bacterium]
MLPLSSYGQESEARSGSAYSSIGLGNPADSFSAGTVGMGLSGVSVHDPYTANSANPALWGVGPYTQGSIVFGLQRYNATDGLESTVYNQFTVNQFQLVLPVVRSRFGISVGFFPTTRSNFDLGVEGSVSPDGEPIDYFNRIQGSGGGSKAELGFGYRLSESLAAGYAASVHFASLNREINTAFDSEAFSNLAYSENISGRALGHRFGLYGRTSDFLRNRDEVSFGASVSLPVTIETERSVSAFRETQNDFSSVDLLPENYDRTGEVQIPLEFNLGLTYNPGPLFNLSLEYQEQLWGQTRYSLDSDQENYLADRSKIGMGAQFHPYRRDGSGGFFSGFKYSAGVTYDTGHLMVEDEQIETLMFHTGLGILSRRTPSSIDLSFQFGFRGTETKNLVKETMWGLKISFNLAEGMFVRSRFQ